MSCVVLERFLPEKRCDAFWFYVFTTPIVTVGQKVSFSSILLIQGHPTPRETRGET